jgi:acyl-CoA synthetase (AMP-forming)/AMP-acid ligase II
MSGIGMGTDTFTRGMWHGAICERGCGILLTGRKLVFPPCTIQNSSDAKLTIVQELIKVRGFQVAPAEIEGVLLHHPNVMDAAVIGIQYSIEDSELPRAYVVVRPGATVTEQEVRDYARERLARYKNLDGGIKFVESIPKNASGKILKNQLREQARREVGARL